MAHPHLSTELARFTARIHRTKNRLISVPAEVQRQVGLRPQTENHIVLVSVRRRGRGRWTHHYCKLTYDNEFAISSGFEQLRPGDEVEVKLHRVIRDLPAPTGRDGAATFEGAGVLLDLASSERPGWREDGSQRLDDYLRKEK